MTCCGGTDPRPELPSDRRTSGRVTARRPEEGGGGLHGARSLALLGPGDGEAMTDLTTSTTTTIDAPVEEVWDAITTPDLIEKWFFGVETETDWQPGSPIVHRGEWQGKLYQDKGEIV